MSATERGVRFDAELGFNRLDPPPTDAELAEFYGSEYYDGGDDRRAPDLARLIAQDEAAAAERRWRCETIYPDVLHYAAALGVEAGAVLDVGCGTGEFVDFLMHVGTDDRWRASGLELAPDAVALAQSRGLDVRRGSLDLLGAEHAGHYDLVTMFNVLEHLADPVAALVASHDLLRPGGGLVVQVPNDFSTLQVAVRDHLDVDPWWIAVPDHVNYFDFDSLTATLNRHGFTRQIRYSTFPMEFFLVAGVDYLGDRSAGSSAHRARCDFEMSLSPDVRRRLYEELAAAGLGRNCVVVASRD